MLIIGIFFAAVDVVDPAVEPEIWDFRVEVHPWRMPLFIQQKDVLYLYNRNALIKHGKVFSINIDISLG